MNGRTWIKVYVDTLDNPAWGKLSDTLWRRMMELNLLAGRVNRDGALISPEGIAWSLHMNEAQLLEELPRLGEAGLLRETQPGEWLVSDFKDRQAPMKGWERVRQHRRAGVVTDRYSEGNADETHTSSTSPSPSSSLSLLNSNSDSESDSDSDSVSASDSDSVSTSGSDSDSDSDSGATRSTKVRPPATLKEAELQPDLRAYMDVTGRYPAPEKYALIIDVIQRMRSRRRLDDDALRKYLLPFWRTWTRAYRSNGRKFNPGNLAWLTEWALNDHIPAKLSYLATIPGVDTESDGAEETESAEDAPD